MKNFIITLLLVLLFNNGFSQNLYYTISGAYTHRIIKEQLNQASTMEDLVPGYPSTWIADYISTEISSTREGKIIKAESKNDTLSAEQKNILKMADAGTELEIKVNYRFLNIVLDTILNTSMDYSVTVVPEVEAQYIGGQEQMLSYLKKNGINKLPKTDPKEFQRAVIKFTVNENGEVADARVSSSSGNSKIDKLLLKTINKMQKWKPAENSQGRRVRQEFRFSVGVEGC